MLSESTWLEAGLVLVRMTVAGTLWLTIGAMLLLVIREPARRTRACGLILLGCLLIPPLAMTAPGNVWEPPAIMQIKGADLIERHSSAEPTFLSLPVSDSVTAAPRGVPPDAWSNTQPGVRESANRGEDAMSGNPSTPWMPFQADPPAIPVTGASRDAIVATSPAEAAVSWWGVGAAAYFFGAGVFALWYVAGLAGLGRLVRGSGAPSPALESHWETVRGDDLLSTPLRISGELRQPIACWWRRSIVLLPAGWNDVGHDQIEAALAHEAEHVRRGDFWWWQAANLARIVFWFHPLAWWLRRELRIGQDFLADAAVVRARKSKVEYAEFLTSSACLELPHTSLVGLGLLGRRSELYRRVAMLLKRERPLELRAPRWWNAALLSGGILALGAVTTMRVIADPAPASIPLPPASRAVDSASLSPRSISANVPAPAAHSSDPFVADVPRPGALNQLIPADPVPGNAPGLDLFPPVPGPDADASLDLPPGGSPTRGDAAPELGDRGILPGAPLSPTPLPRNPSGAPGISLSPPGGEGNAAPAPREAVNVIRKLAIQNETVEPEAGVTISIVSLTDAEGVSWKPDGSRIDPGEGGGGGGGYPFGGGGMGGAPGGYAGAGSSMMMPPGGVPSLAPDARQRTVYLRVQRPLPAGLHVSVDGQSIQRSSTSLPDSKARQITQMAYWPDEQTEGSVGVRFASKTVAQELSASKREGETIASKEGGIEARLGAWRQGNDLQTEIPLDGVQPSDPAFVVVAQAVDVEGKTHAGRIEHRSKGEWGAASSYGLGPAMVGGPQGMEGIGGGGRTGKGEWLMVFPHLPADRIAQVRLTWHPYAWVIFRGISLEPDHKTTPTAELYIDQSKPAALPDQAEDNTSALPDSPDRHEVKFR